MSSSTETKKLGVLSLAGIFISAMIVAGIYRGKICQVAQKQKNLEFFH